jgi:hypothetical protein
MVARCLAPEIGRREDITKNVVAFIAKKPAFRLSIGQAAFLWRLLHLKARAGLSSLLAVWRCWGVRELGAQRLAISNLSSRRVYCSRISSVWSGMATWNLWRTGVRVRSSVSMRRGRSKGEDARYFTQKVGLNWPDDAPEES